MMVWHSHLFKNFFTICCDPNSQSLLAMKQKFSDVFLEFPCLLCDPTDVGNLFSGSSAFSKSILCTSGSSQFTYN